MDLKGATYKELVRELLLREPGRHIQIEINKIMMIKSYHPGIWNGKAWDIQPIEFEIQAESHETQNFSSVDEAVEAFFQWAKRGDTTRKGE